MDPTHALKPSWTSALLIVVLLCLAAALLWFFLQPPFAIDAAPSPPNHSSLVTRHSSLAISNKPSDVNGDGVINIIDVQLVASCWNKLPSAPGCSAAYDLNGDGIIDLADSAIVSGLWKSSYTQMASNPANGEEEVAVTRETVIRFTRPINPAGVTAANFFAQFAGRSLPARLQLTSDRKTVYLFYSPPLPSSARIRITVNGSALLDDGGNAVDADGDGRPGGIGAIDFNTLSLTRIAGTNVFGYVYERMKMRSANPRE